jgi:cation diffusion facilitator CzcD-associated flavoprotein CzcO
MGCKRILISNDYYPALCHPHVELVTDAVREIRPHSVVTSDGRERPVDAIVWATGFEAADGHPPFPIRGEGARLLDDEWRTTYLGTAVPGFPNFFFILGPNTGLGHNSMIYMMESQFAYLLDGLRTMRERNLRRVAVRPEVARDYREEMAERTAGTVWKTDGCRSWYISRDGTNTTLWPGFTWQFRLRTRAFDWQSYEVTGEVMGDAD